MFLFKVRLVTLDKMTVNIWYHVSVNCFVDILTRQRRKALPTFKLRLFQQNLNFIGHLRSSGWLPVITKTTSLRSYRERRRIHIFVFSVQKMV